MFKRSSSRRNAIHPMPLNNNESKCISCSINKNLLECKFCKIYLCKSCTDKECIVCNKKIEIRNPGMVEVKLNKYICNIL